MKKKKLCLSICEWGLRVTTVLNDFVRSVADHDYVPNSFLISLSSAATFWLLEIGLWQKQQFAIRAKRSAYSYQVPDPFVSKQAGALFIRKMAWIWERFNGMKQYSKQSQLRYISCFLLCTEGFGNWKRLKLTMDWPRICLRKSSLWITEKWLKPVDSKTQCFVWDVAYMDCNLFELGCYWTVQTLAFSNLQAPSARKCGSYLPDRL